MANAVAFECWLCCWLTERQNSRGRANRNYEWMINERTHKCFNTFSPNINHFGYVDYYYCLFIYSPYKYEWQKCQNRNISDFNFVFPMPMLSACVNVMRASNIYIRILCGKAILKPVDFWMSKLFIVHWTIFVETLLWRRVWMAQRHMFHIVVYQLCWLAGYHYRAVYITHCVA